MSAQRIPVENIYFLLCYAWNHLQETKYAQVRSEGCDKVWDLLAKVLIRSSQQLVKRGLHRNYLVDRELRVRPKGKVMWSEDMRRPSRATLVRTYEFDELSADVLPNQIVAAAFKILARHPNLTAENRSGLRDAAAPFSRFTPLSLKAQHFRRVSLNGNMRHYRFVLNACELIHRHAVPMEDSGSMKFRDFDRDEATMGALFEQFIRNFYSKEQSIYRVSAPHVEWDLNREESSAGGVALLPTMKTDICMISPTDRLIIDCKFYQDAFQHHHDTKKFISGHIYQLFSYLRNRSAIPGWQAVRGMLLYPTVDKPIDEVVSLQGHKVRVASIHLGQRWEGVARDLMKLIGVPAT